MDARVTPPATPAVRMHAPVREPQKSELGQSLDRAVHTVRPMSIALGLAATIAMLPLAPRAPVATAIEGARTLTPSARLAKLASSTRLGASALHATRSTRHQLGIARTAIAGTAAGAAAFTAAGNASRSLRSARLVLGQTQVGQALIRAQWPLAVASATLGTVSLARDLNDFREGQGSFQKLFFSTLAVVPVASQGVQKISRARAASAEAQAARDAASMLEQVEQRTSSALRMTDAAADAQPAEPVMTRLREAAHTSRSARTAAARSAEAVSPGSGAGAAMPALPKADTFVVGQLRSRVAEVHDTTAQALHATRNLAPTPPVEADLDGALAAAQAAELRLQAVETTSARLTKTAKTAAEVQLAARNTYLHAGIVNSGYQAHRGMAREDDATAADGTRTLAQNLVRLVLKRNAG